MRTTGGSRYTVNVRSQAFGPRAEAGAESAATGVAVTGGQRCVASVAAVSDSPSRIVLGEVLAKSLSGHISQRSGEDRAALRVHRDVRDFFDA
jgi:hypothetical protein